MYFTFDNNEGDDRNPLILNGSLNRAVAPKDIIERRGMVLYPIPSTLRRNILRDAAEFQHTNVEDNRQQILQSTTRIISEITKVYDSFYIDDMIVVSISYIELSFDDSELLHDKPDYSYFDVSRLKNDGLGKFIVSYDEAILLPYRNDLFGICSDTYDTYMTAIRQLPGWSLLQYGDVDIETYYLNNKIKSETEDELRIQEPYGQALIYYMNT